LHAVHYSERWLSVNEWSTSSAISSEIPRNSNTFLRFGQKYATIWLFY